jgi:hypothetical protein
MMLMFLIKGAVLQVSFFFLTGLTGVAMFLFLIEGLLLFRKLNPNRT